MKLHWESMCSEVKSCYNCVFCNASFTRRDSWQRQLRRVHRRICGEQDINVFLHLQHLSEEEDFQNEWMFVESRPIEANEHKICPCGQTGIQAYFFVKTRLMEIAPLWVQHVLRTLFQE